MIYYFSGTGNSRHVATQLSSMLDSPLAEMTAPIHADSLTDATVVGLVFPVYAWGIPSIVNEFIRHIPASPSDCFTFAVMTCGDDMGYTDHILSKALRKRGWTLHAAFSVQMRNTYVCLPGFDIDSAEVERKKGVQAEERIHIIAEAIKQRQKVGSKYLVRGAMPWTKSYILRPLFNHFLISDRQFHVNGHCIQCGLCIKQCPLHNLTADNQGRPRWNGHCTLCLRCYHACPKHAIDYGKFTHNKGQVKINF